MCCVCENLWVCHWLSLHCCHNWFLRILIYLNEYLVNFEHTAFRQINDWHVSVLFILRTEFRTFMAMQGVSILKIFKLIKFHKAIWGRRTTSQVFLVDDYTKFINIYFGCSSIDINCRTWKTLVLASSSSSRIAEKLYNLIDYKALWTIYILIQL